MAVHKGASEDHEQPEAHRGNRAVCEGMRPQWKTLLSASKGALGVPPPLSNGYAQVSLHLLTGCCKLIHAQCSRPKAASLESHNSGVGATEEYVPCHDLAALSACHYRQSQVSRQDGDQSSAACTRQVRKEPGRALSRMQDPHDRFWDSPIRVQVPVLKLHC